MSDENLDEEFENTRSQVEQDQEEVEDIEDDAKRREDNVESEEESVGAEIKDAEKTGNSEELADAEQRTEDELENESQVEEETEEAAEDISEQIKLEEKQEQLLEQMQKHTRSEFKDALSSLKQEKKKLLGVKDKENTKIRPQDYQDIEQALNEFRDATGNVHRFTRELEELLQETSRTEDEDNYLKDLISRLPEELEIIEEEVTELLVDFKKLQDSEHSKIAKKEKQQTTQLEKREQNLEQAKQSIDQELQKEVQEAEHLVREDEQMIELINQSITELNELYEILEQEKTIWRSTINQNPPLDDVGNTIEMLKKVMGEDESELEKAGKFASNLMQKGPSAKTAAKWGSKAAVAGVAIFGVLVVIAWQSI